MGRMQDKIKIWGLPGDDKEKIKISIKIYIDISPHRYVYIISLSSYKTGI